MEIAFQIAVESNIEEILPMMAAFNAIDSYPFNGDLTRANLQKFITDESLGRLWIIKSSENTIGYVALTFGFSFEFKGATAFIDELFLKEPFRGKGLGGKVIDFILVQAENLKLKALHLEVERHNEKGNKLYAKKGFREHNRMLMTKFMT
jgi:diamine N-acetyltransferase